MNVDFAMIDSPSHYHTPRKIELSEQNEEFCIFYILKFQGESNLFFESTTIDST